MKGVGYPFKPCFDGIWTDVLDGSLVFVGGVPSEGEANTALLGWGEIAQYHDVLHFEGEVVGVCMRCHFWCPVSLSVLIIRYVFYKSILQTVLLDIFVWCHNLKKAMEGVLWH